MSERIFVKPVGDLKVYNPRTARFISPSGEWVKNSQYWSRRLADKSITVHETAETKPDAKIKKPKTSQDANIEKPKKNEETIDTPAPGESVIKKKSKKK